MSPLRRSNSMRSMRCMGKNTALGVTMSPALTWRMKSSMEFRSMPRTLTPGGARLRIAPQNFSRGEFSVTRTTALEAKGPTSAAFDVRFAFCIAQDIFNILALPAGKASRYGSTDSECSSSVWGADAYSVGSIKINKMVGTRRLEFLTSTVSTPHPWATA